MKFRQPVILLETDFKNQYISVEDKGAAAHYNNSEHGPAPPAA